MTCALGLAAASAQAKEIELSFYGGWQSAGDSHVSGSSPYNGNFDDLIDWDGKSFSMPPYYGVRATWWRDDAWGFGLEFTHDKVYASDASMAAAGFTTLEFSDGLNIVTVNLARRWQQEWGNFSPYVAGGVGVAVPHVEVQSPGGPKTFDYQMAGPALRLTAGLSYPLSDHWSAFGEYQFTYSDNKTDLDGGGNLDTSILTNAVNVGVGFRF